MYIYLNLRSCRFSRKRVKYRTRRRKELGTESLVIRLTCVLFGFNCGFGRRLWALLKECRPFRWPFFKPRHAVVSRFSYSRRCAGIVPWILIVRHSQAAPAVQVLLLGTPPPRESTSSPANSREHRVENAW